MKIPAFAKVLIKTPVLTFCLFLFSCLFFLLAGPNISKPVYAAPSCIINTQPPTVQAGNTVNIGYFGFAAGEGFVLSPTDGGAPVPTNMTTPTDSTVNAVATNVVIPASTPVNTYNMVIVTRFPITYTICSQGPISVTAQPPILSCQYTYPSSVAPGGTLSVTITGNTGNGTYAAGIANQDSTAISAANGGPIRVTKTGSPTITIDVPVPSQLPAGQYLVVATKDPTPLCGGDPNLRLTVTPVPTPTPTPPTGPCSVTSTGGWTLNAPTVSGNNVTFNFNPQSNGNIGLIVDKDSTFSSFPTRPFDSGAIASGQSSTSWNGAPEGTYCAVLVFATTYVSNAVSFTVGPTTGDGDTCSSSTLMWVNDVRCRAIAGGWFDSDVFTLGQSALTLESLNFIIWGESSLNKKWNTSITKRTGALALTGQVVASLYSAPPASGVQYFAQKIHDLNPVTPAYAAAGGIGYQTLGPVQKIWIAFRNIAYVGFIIVFVIMGFMIMFRAHISPQAVATVQDSIPRLVIALILVTFSYAIAGFMIDIMFLILNIAIQALVSAKLLTGADYVFQKNVFQVIWGSWKDIFGSVASALSTLIDNAITLPLFFDNLFGWVGGTLSAIVIGIAILFIMFRIFLMLLMAYVMIILLTMFAPFFFLIQALPGNNGAKEWFRQMASNIAVFPTVALMFVLAGILGGIGALAPGASAAIQPGQIGQFPLIIGNLDATAIGQLIGIGFLLITPSAADLVKNALGSKGQGGGLGNMGAAALAGAGAGMAVVGAAGRGAGGALTSRGPIGGWRRAQEARRGEDAQRRAGAGIYSKEYREWQENLAKTRRERDA